MGGARTGADRDLVGKTLRADAGVSKSVSRGEKVVKEMDLKLLNR